MRCLLAAAAVLAASLFGSPATSAPEPVYYQDILFAWDDVKFDIVVIPPNHGQVYNGNGPAGGGDPNELTPTNSYLRAIEDSIQAWDDAVDEYAEPFLRRHFESRVYVAGRDPLPEDGEDVEIVIVTDESKAVILGVAVFADRPCIVDNSKFFVESFTYEDMFSVNAQEYGHCLGLAHVRNNEPAHDALDGSYDDQPGAAGVHLHCPSNLNVYGLHATLGGSHEYAKRAIMPASQYEQMPCERKFSAKKP